MRVFLLACLLLQSAWTLASTPDQQCGQLLRLDVPGTEIQQAVYNPDRTDLPAFCELRGEIVERVKFVMRLPASDWNGKFVVTGCGGFCGYLRPDKPGYSNSINEALKLGYAAIQTDSGHQAPNWSTDWAIGDEKALRLYAGEWMPLATATGRSLVAAFYQQQPARTYFQGCSNGGRLGMFAAQRYPELFDGIAAGGGIFDLTGNAGIHGLWILQTTRDKDGKAVIDQAKVPLIANHVRSRCDALDGVEDGVVAAPERCDPDVKALLCDEAGSDNCLTRKELVAVERLYQGARVEGKQLFPGVNPGSESLWPIWLVGTDERRAWGELASEGMLRLTYGLTSDKPFNAHDYLLAKELENLEKYAPVVNATDPDLGGLEQAGGKLFYYHGLADPLILAGRVQQYREQALAVMGEARLDRVARFIMIPGHGHCWEKPGQVADDFNPLEVIDQWVETGIAPDEVIARRISGASGEPVSRKLCALPMRAAYVDGDGREAENFSCK
jgi:feruloyl esterase